MDLDQSPLSQIPPKDYLVNEAQLNNYVMDLYPDLLKRCPKLPKTEQNNARVVLHLCEQSASVVEMMEATGYESRTSFRRKILTPLLEAGLIKPVLGDKNSPKQRYTI